MPQGRRWTPAEHLKALRMRQEGYTWSAIAKAFGRTAQQVSGHFHWAFASPEKKQIIAQKIRQYRREGHDLRSVYRDIRQSLTENTREPPDPAALADREYRLALPPRDLSALFFGDPPPGYSALDRKLPVVSRVKSIAISETRPCISGFPSMSLSGSTTE